jgi:hypothetical protein
MVFDKFLVGAVDTKIMKPRSLFRGESTTKTVLSPEKNKNRNPASSSTSETQLAEIPYLSRIISDVSNKVRSSPPTQIIFEEGEALIARSKAQLKIQIEIALKKNTNPDDTESWKSVEKEGKKIATSAMLSSGNHNSIITLE